MKSNRKSVNVDRNINRLSNRTVAFVLAGGRGSRLKELTDKRAKPAVFFGGKSRIIDFALSNAYNSGIRKMAVATQYKAHSLVRHLQRGWSFFRAERNEFLDILPASQQMDEENWYKGTADAVRQNIQIIDSYHIDYIMVLAGDHIYKMDYEIMLRQHVESQADVTVGCLTVNRKEASAFGVLNANDKKQITEFLEKPANPPSMPGNPDKSLASMGIYVFNWQFLRQMLLEDAENPDSTHDFGHDIIPNVVKNGNAIAHYFDDSFIMSGLEQTAYWRDVGTIDAFHSANTDLTNFKPELDLYDHSWPIWTYSENVPPAKFVHDEEGRRGSATSSLISGDCIISGAKIKTSLLFTGVRCHSFSALKNSVVLPYANISRKASLKNAVIDRGVNIPEGLIVGEDSVEDARWFRRTESGIVLITQNMIDNRALKVGKAESIKEKSSV